MTSDETGPGPPGGSPTHGSIVCPFCGAPLTDRIEVDGQRFFVFRCMFTPEVPRQVEEDAVPEYLRKQFGTDGSGYFRATCDRLHMYVVRPEASSAAPPTEP